MVVTSTNNDMVLHYKEVFALYTCMRQITLSVHRCRWTSWKDLNDFYREKIAPQKMLDMLSTRLGNKSEFIFYEIHENKHSWSRAKYLAMRMIGVKKFSFSITQIETACYLLHYFLIFLKEDNPDVNSLNKLMSEISRYMHVNLETKLSLKDINTPIEHYLESKNGQTQSFEVLTGYK